MDITFSLNKLRKILTYDPLDTELSHKCIEMYFYYKDFHPHRLSHA